MAMGSSTEGFKRGGGVWKSYGKLVCCWLLTLLSVWDKIQSQKCVALAQDLFHLYSQILWLSDALGKGKYSWFDNLLIKAGSPLRCFQDKVANWLKEGDQLWLNVQSIQFCKTRIKVFKITFTMGSQIIHSKTQDGPSTIFPDYC